MESVWEMYSLHNEHEVDEDSYVVNGIKSITKRLKRGNHLYLGGF